MSILSFKVFASSFKLEKSNQIVFLSSFIFLEFDKNIFTQSEATTVFNQESTITFWLLVLEIK